MLVFEPRSERVRETFREPFLKYNKIRAKVDPNSRKMKKIAGFV